MAGCSQTYIHYVFNGDRIPSTKMAKRLEQITGVCREAWLWPERHYNPYIPFSDITECGGCSNKIHLIKKTNEVAIKIFSNSIDKRKAFKEMLDVMMLINGSPQGRIILFREILPDKLKLISSVGLTKQNQRPKFLSGKPHIGIIESAHQGKFVAVPHWPHDIPFKHPKAFHGLDLNPKSYYWFSSGRHLTLTIISLNDTMIFRQNVLEEYHRFIKIIDELWHLEKNTNSPKKFRIS